MTLLTKVHLVKSMVFPVVMYGCESWTIKKTEHRRIDVFELWCWRRFLRVTWAVQRSNQSILKEISPGCSLEGLMQKLKCQYFGHLMQKAIVVHSVVTNSLGPHGPHGLQHARLLCPLPSSRVCSNSCESVMPSNHLILCHPLLLLLSILPSIRVYSSESALHIRKRP